MTMFGKPKLKIMKKSSFYYFALAGVIGSFSVVSDKGWLYLIPFWIGVVLISKLCDWLISRWG